MIGTGRGESLLTWSGVVPAELTSKGPERNGDQYPLFRILFRFTLQQKIMPGASKAISGNTQLGLPILNTILLKEHLNSDVRLPLLEPRLTG